MKRLLKVSFLLFIMIILTGCINKEKGLLVIKTTINYKKMNLKKFVNYTPAMKAYVNKSNQLTINERKNMYKLGEITCEK